MLKTILNQLTPITASLFSSKTRSKILVCSLVLFNDRGFNNVTTASIANKTDVLEGSLWYHFNTKKDILSAHIELLNQQILTENQKAKSTDFETIVSGIFRAYDLIWDFRYILRDDFQKSSAVDELVLRAAQNINNYIDKWVEGRIEHSYENGLLQIDPQEIQNISEITLVIGRYWLDYSGKKHPDVNDTSLRTKGLNHIFTVLKPYISSKANTVITRMMAER
ncbi:MAG: TetR/AcrR family transcriptional regulator [Flavobacteriales bacterium]|nr:TetR/AcrR family transcriptional regulator [Flavobacteriales bacterium]